jgi:hypothetical protein
MAPPTIANGMVYLASFGTQNIGTGQLCVYGLLPDGSAPPAPTQVRASVAGRFIYLQWDAVEGAVTYTVESTEGGSRHVIVSGVTKPNFTEPAAITGSPEYTVIAVGFNGQSARSIPAIVTVEKVPMTRMAH